MSVSRSIKPLCTSCQTALLRLFSKGFTSTALNCKSNTRLNLRPRLTHAKLTRALHSTRERRKANQNIEQATTEATSEGNDHHAEEISSSLFAREAVVRQARQEWGETLPEGYLSPAEYKIYERLYGPALQETQLEEIEEQLQQVEETGPSENDDSTQNTLFKENDEGRLEELSYENDLEIKDFEADGKLPQEEAQSSDRAQIAVYKDMLTAMEEQLLEEDTRRDSLIEGDEVTINEDELDDSYRDVDIIRSHPLTTAGRFSTSPTTLHLPRDTFVMPITAMLATSSNKHLTEIAQRSFGGPGLPNSTATPSSKRHLQQAPVGLEASQSSMGEMEANAYLAAVMPGSYASVMSSLVEIRKRLGSEWIEGLLKKPGGARILDTGAGGAGVLAWRDVLRAEWQRMHPRDASEINSVPLGKATVIIGSSELRHRASLLLENTTFLPRLPDYIAARDLPIPPKNEPPSRKQYDIIVAPHTLWTLKEDYIRKAHVQNLWALLNPSGGVLIIIEKGLPRGFELVAGAREVLLKHHISSPGATEIENELHNQTHNRYQEKEEGMIIAPCTNHAQCPMYAFSGHSKGRKDHCHFSQRFIRPPYLQHILGARDRNYEDVRFSYIAVRRGEDRRRAQNIEQGDTATLSAVEGYEYEMSSSEDSKNNRVKSPQISPSDSLFFSLPRAILPPLKRRGHVVLDLCTPSGKIERWTVPKSFSKQAYRDARKSKWGDLWALGAKVRIERSPRVGTRDDKSKPKRIIEVGIGEEDEDDVIRDITPNQGEHMKKGRKGRKERPKKLSKYLKDLL